MTWLAIYVIGALITGGYMAAHCAKHKSTRTGPGIAATATIVVFWPVFALPSIGMEIYEQHSAAADARDSEEGGE